MSAPCALTKMTDAHAVPLDTAKLVFGYRNTCPNQGWGWGPQTDKDQPRLWANGVLGAQRREKSNPLEKRESGEEIDKRKKKRNRHCPPLSLPVTLPRSQEPGWVLPFTARLSSALVPGPIQTTDGQNLNSSIASSHGIEYPSFPDPRAL